MVDVVVEKNFPVANLVPKIETGCAAFLAKYPEYNGDGVTIAIFDSGVDPLAVGMQTTPDGRPKVVERYDCSGCGDVDTTKIVKADADGSILGVSGRSMRLTERMVADNADDGQYRVGIKCLFDVFPSRVRDRVLGEAKQRNWDTDHKAAIAEVARTLEKFDIAHPGLPANLPLADRLARENIEQSLEALNAWEKSYLTWRPQFDCVLYRTATDGWRAVIDTSEVGDLQNGLELTEYSRTHEVGSLFDHLSVSMNVYDDGNLMELVGMCSSHGTHVASIASGNHTDDAALNGIAPGASLISLTIGDSRLGSMETGTALVRAMIRVMELCEAGRRVHVINMSYGEHAHFSASGRLGAMMCEVVNRYGVVWVASAGNHGPALCTIGTPPDIEQPIFIGVGAYVSPEMIEAEYALRHKLPANCYTWTSRDPCIDGGQGVTVCAPGAAIASVPEFTQSKQQLMHGTSMAAPHVAGAVALLLSGLLKLGRPFSPYSVKRALWNTATRLDSIDAFAQGNGLLNVPRAFEQLAVEQVDTMVRYAVTVDPQNKGIHMRVANPVAKEYTVQVEPLYLNDKYVAHEDKIKFNVRSTLVASEAWIRCGTFFDLSYTSRMFNVTVDPTALPPGVHTARIRAYDSANVARGILFEVPITVVVPHIVDPSVSNTFTIAPATYKASTITRTFLQVPAKCTWAVLRLRSPNSTTSLPARFFVHTLQIAPQLYCKDYETQKLFCVQNESQTVHAFRCLAENVLEVCIAKFWSTGGEAQLEASVEFRGIHTSASAAIAEPVHTMHSSMGVHRIDLSTAVADEAMPAVQLKTAVMVLRPNEQKITPMGVRDAVPPSGRLIYQNVLTYALHLGKASEVSLHAPLLSDYLYESEFESQLWQLFDVNRMMVLCGDAYSSEAFIKLEKGEYVARLQVRHERRDLLERVNDTTMLVTFKLPSAIALEAHVSYRNAIHGAKKSPTILLRRNAVRPIYLAPLTSDKITKANVPSQCSWLNGSLSLTKDELGRKLEVNNFRYILTEGPQPKKPNGASNGGVPHTTATNGQELPVRSKYDEYKDQLRDVKCAGLAKLDLADAERLYAEIVEEYPDHVAVHIAMIHKLDPPTEIRNQLPHTVHRALAKVTDSDALRATQRRIVELADRVIDGTDQSALLTYMGTKVDTRTDAVKIKSVMDKQRSTLIEAITRKYVAMGKLRIISELDRSNSDDEEYQQLIKAMQQLYLDVGKFVDYTDVKVAPLVLWHSFHLLHHGRQLKTLQKMYEDKWQRPYVDEMLWTVTDRQWNHLPLYLRRLMTTANPAEYRIF